MINAGNKLNTKKTYTAALFSNKKVWKLVIKVLKDNFQIMPLDSVAVIFRLLIILFIISYIFICY